MAGMTEMRDIVSDLRSDAAQLMRQSENAKLAGQGCAVRVAAPELLHASLSDAADILEDLRQASRALVDEINRHAASGLMTRRCLVLCSQLEQKLRAM